MQLREVNLHSQLKDRTTLEKQVEEMKAEVSTASQGLKVRSTSPIYCVTLLPNLSILG